MADLGCSALPLSHEEGCNDWLYIYQCALFTMRAYAIRHEGLFLEWERVWQPWQRILVAMDTSWVRASQNWLSSTVLDEQVRARGPMLWIIVRQLTTLVVHIKPIAKSPRWHDSLI